MNLISKGYPCGLVPVVRDKAYFFVDIDDLKHLKFADIADQMIKILILIFGNDAVKNVYISKNEQKDKFHMRFPGIIMTKKGMLKLWNDFNTLWGEKLIDTKAGGLRYPFFDKWDNKKKCWTANSKYYPVDLQTFSLLSKPDIKFLSICYIRIPNDQPVTKQLHDFRFAVNFYKENEVLNGQNNDENIDINIQNEVEISNHNINQNVVLDVEEGKNESDHEEDVEFVKTPKIKELDRLNSFYDELTIIKNQMKSSLDEYEHDLLS